MNHIINVNFGEESYKTQKFPFNLHERVESFIMCVCVYVWLGRRIIRPDKAQTTASNPAKTISVCSFLAPDHEWPSGLFL